MDARSKEKKIISEKKNTKLIPVAKHHICIDSLFSAAQYHATQHIAT
jgi:hypothetical protein